MKFLISSIYQNNGYDNVGKRPRVCNFNPEIGKPIGGLVDQFDADHKNPQFVVMMDWRVLLFYSHNLVSRTVLDMRFHHN